MPEHCEVFASKSPGTQIMDSVGGRLISLTVMSPAVTLASGQILEEVQAYSERIVGMSG